MSALLELWEVLKATLWKVKMTAKKRTVGRSFVEFVFMIHMHEVSHLLELAKRQKQRRDQEIICRAAIVFLVAVWQTYVEAIVDDITTVPDEGGPFPGKGARLSTPNVEQINRLFKKQLRIEAISHSWKWRGMTADHSARKLDKLMKLRHQFAHKARGAVIRPSEALQYTDFVHRLAVCTFNALLPHLTRMRGQSLSSMKYEGIVGRLSPSLV
jgi:hypothetical protein